jgi:hypothetical protein
MKLKRNHWCPCGSGLKYKNCHLHWKGFGDPLLVVAGPESKQVVDRFCTLLEQGEEEEAERLMFATWPPVARACEVGRGLMLKARRLRGRRARRKRRSRIQEPEVVTQIASASEEARWEATERPGAS